MRAEQAKKLHAQLGMTQWYELCNDWLDEKDILRAINPPKINGKKAPSMIPELAFQGMCRGDIPEYAVKRKINAMTVPMVI
ncbi:hypothetical protein NE287_06175 [Pediococcus pentosaceus]|uniref:hypothetical protein n=1 Tax=Pediococcus pentosaceus TaxID=1255 RepID=UPI002072A723|nr:hypothetical protein [Pediococcus pentosaceus]MCM6810353.1 hypothetical protein [Pediococcus pentosaceus]